MLDPEDDYAITQTVSPSLTKLTNFQATKEVLELRNKFSFFVSQVRNKFEGNLARLGCRS